MATIKGLESALKDTRIEFVEETTPGEPPTDPAWAVVSDRVLTFQPNADPNITPREKIGTAYPQGADPGTEAHDLSVGYVLQQWFLNSSGDPLDIGGYFTTRDADFDVQSTLTIVARTLKNLGGVESNGVRTYHVLTGCVPSVLTIPADPGESGGLEPTAEFFVAKYRTYEIHQPPSGGDTVDVVSTDDADTMDITIEDDSGTSETLTLTGTTPVTGVTSFSSIDAVRLTAESEGDVTVSATTSSNTLLTIEGKASYQGREGDLGTPLLGAGSHGSAIGTDPLNFIGNSIQRGGNDLGEVLTDLEASIENELERDPRVDTVQQAIVSGMQRASVNASIFGSAEVVDALRGFLQVETANIVWTFSNGETLTFHNTYRESTEPDMIEAGQTRFSVGETFQANEGDSGEAPVVASTPA